jgi:hypothetical protein
VTLWNVARAGLQAVGAFILISDCKRLTDEHGTNSGFQLISQGFDARMYFQCLATLPAAMQFIFQVATLINGLVVLIL